MIAVHSCQGQFQDQDQGGRFGRTASCWSRRTRPTEHRGRRRRDDAVRNSLILKRWIDHSAHAYTDLLRTIAAAPRAGE